MPQKKIEKEKINMVYIVRYNGEETEFDDPQEANEFAIGTGLDFPDIIIVEK